MPREASRASRARRPMPRGSRHPALVIHGGTGSMPDRRRIAAYCRSLRAIGRDAYRHLQRHSALETVVYAVSLLEDDPLFNAGTGSMLQRDGVARMSASVMDGSAARFAAVLNIDRVRHPVAVASDLLGRPDRILAGSPATEFARQLGHGDWDPITPERRRQWEVRLEGSHGTVGAVALDAEGRLAAATSTGGRGFEQPGRVSDSGLPAGNYATSDLAVSCTGVGEDIIEEGLATRLAQRVADGQPPARAVSATAKELKARARRCGLIALDRRGRWYWTTTQPMLFAVAISDQRHDEAF